MRIKSQLLLVLHTVLLLTPAQLHIKISQLIFIAFAQQCNERLKTERRLLTGCRVGELGAGLEGPGLIQLPAEGNPGLKCAV